MIYKVIIQPPAGQDIDEIVAYIAANSPDNAERWLSAVLDAIRSLRRYPKRCPLAPEDPYFVPEIRHLIHGNYRIIFTVDRAVVRVLHVRHAARRPLGQPGSDDDE